MQDDGSTTAESPPSVSPARQGSRARGLSHVEAARVRRNHGLNDKKKKSNASQQVFGPADVKKLKVTLQADLRGNAKAFWEALKILVFKTYETTESAWTANACPQDDSMSWEQFQTMCLTLGLTMSSSMLRTLFESQLRDGETVWYLQDFYDALVLATVERMRGRLTEFSRTQSAIKSRISTFLDHLALRTGEQNQRRAVTRFQRKLDVAFCQDVWRALQRWVLRRLASQGDSANEISCEEFIKVLSTTNRMLEYELDFIRQIFDHVDRSSDRSHRGRVTTTDLAVALALLGTDSSRYEKAWFLFSVFDSDSDGCLTCEQILRLYCCTAIHGNIARNDKPMYDADIALGDELSLAKARRLYDYTVTLLSHAQDDFYSFQEWWSVLSGNDMLQEELLPGCTRIMWVLQPPRPQSPQKSPRDAKACWKMLRSASKQKVAERKRHRPALVSTGPLINQLIEASARTASKQLRMERNERPERSDLRASENFRMHAAIRFRHAVRGEWDRIDALRTAPNLGALQLHRTSSKLPALPAIGGGLTSCSSSRGFFRSTSATELESAAAQGEPDQATAVWIDALGSFKSRQKGGHWNRAHGETLSNWSKAGFKPPEADRGRAPGGPRQGLGQSQSLPEIGRPAQRAALRPRRASVVVAPQGHSEIHLGVSSSPPALQAQQRTSRVIANVAQQARSALASMPKRTEQFGDVAMDRFRCLSTVGAACETSPGEGPVGPLPYECKVCGVWHDSGACCGSLDVGITCASARPG